MSNDTKKQIQDLANNELKNLGLGKEEPKPTYSGYSTYNYARSGTGYGRSYGRGEDYFDHLDRPRRFEPISKVEPLTTPRRTYLKSETEARLEGWRDRQRPSGGHLMITNEEFQVVQEELHMAMGDLLERAGFTWRTLGSNGLKAAIRQAIETAFFVEPLSGEMSDVAIEETK
jgi:hypothetical protein